MDAKDGSLFYTGYSGITSADIASLLSKEFTPAEVLVCDSLISSIESHIARQSHRNYLLTATEENVTSDVSYAEVFDVKGCEYIIPNYPAKEITRILVDDAVLYDKTSQSNYLTKNVDFWIRDMGTKILFLSIPSSLTGIQSLIVEHSIKAFYGEDVNLAIKRWVMELFTSKEYGTRGVSQVNMGGVNVMFSTSEIPDYVETIINTYKRRFV
jgi:hypothetical protein